MSYIEFSDSDVNKVFSLSEIPQCMERGSSLGLTMIGVLDGFISWSSDTKLMKTVKTDRNNA